MDLALCTWHYHAEAGKALQTTVAPELDAKEQTATE